MNTRSRRAPKDEPKTLTEQIVESSNSEPEIAEDLVGPDISTITEDRLIPSGVTLINCGCSGNPFGAFAFGSINTIPGKSASGKTELALTILSACASDKRFDEYDLIYDDAEYSNNFDLNYLFPVLNNRLKAPAYDGEESIYSETIQDFEGGIIHRLMDKKNKNKKPFIYILDSLDSLTSSEELEREYKNALKTIKTDDVLKELTKSFNTEKSRIIGQTLRIVNSYIKKSNSALFIIQQTRQNISPAWGEPDWKTAGGDGPFFYSFHRLYLTKGAAIKEKSMNIEHQIGSKTRCEIIKNKLTGKRRKSGIEFDIYEDLGIDDVASCVDFLKMTGHWEMSGSYMTAPGILKDDEKMYRKDLIEFIEKEGIEKELQTIVGKVWEQIEDDIKLKNRKRRF